MNRRRFIQSLAAVFSLPAGAPLSLRPATAALPTAAAVPTEARFWAIYMSAIDGKCTPQTLQKMLHIPEIDAKRYIDELIVHGVIKPNPLLKTSVSKVLHSSENSPLNKLKTRLDKKAQAESIGLDDCETGDETSAETANETENLDVGQELAGASTEAGLDVIAEDEPAELKMQKPDEVKAHG